MEDEGVLERILNGYEEPKVLPLALLQRITNDFSEGRKIGLGRFGEVYKGVLRNGIIVAVKRIHVNVNTIDIVSFRRVINSLMKINHRNVAQFLGFCSYTCQTRIKEDGVEEINIVNTREILVCFEYISNGSLDKHITDELGGLEWETRYEIITGICKGLFYLHEVKHIIHMDLKPANILLDDHMVPIITDFGLSRPNENSHTMGQRFGTRGYIAPEYYAGKISLKCDIYSLGGIIIELVTGCMGVPDKNDVLRRWRHRWSKPPTLVQYQQVTRCIDIAAYCKQQEPECRPSISEIISILTESENTDRHTGQISNYVDEDDMLEIKPLELQLPSELKEEISYDELEKKLQDSNATPMSFPLEFLKAITCDFSTESILGEGGFGVVYKGVLRSGKTIAVKKLFEMHLREDTFQNEVSCLMRIKHQNLVKFLGYCAESSWQAIEAPSGSGHHIFPETPKRLLCFEYVPNKSLDEYISDESSGLEWDMRYEIIKGICNGLHYLHEERRMAHLDLKPENILMDSTMMPKIADFGLSRIFGEQKSRTVTINKVGTLGYMAPEYVLRGIVSNKADIFSLGVIVIEIITGGRDYPWDNRTDLSFQQFTEKVLGSWKNKFVTTLNYKPVEKYTQQVKQCVTIALKCVDPGMEKRPTAKDIIEELNAVDQIGDSHFEMREPII